MDSWRRDLRARNLAPKTIKTYGESADQLVAWLASEHDATGPEAVEKDHIRGFVTHLLDTRSPATASVRFRALQQPITSARSTFNARSNAAASSANCSWDIVREVSGVRPWPCWSKTITVRSPAKADTHDVIESVDMNPPGMSSNGDVLDLRSSPCTS